MRQTGKAPQQKSLSALLKAREHKTIVHSVLDEYARYLAFICLDIMKLMNPHMLVLSGTVIESSNYLLHKVRQIIEQNTCKIPLHIGAVEVGTLGEEAGLSGAIAVALQEVFN
jgi:glucokinase